MYQFDTSSDHASNSRTTEGVSYESNAVVTARLNSLVRASSQASTVCRRSNAGRKPARSGLSSAA
jgi:hypothetical protein